LYEALDKITSYNRDILTRKINYRPEDHIAVAMPALLAYEQSAPVEEKSPWVSVKERAVPEPGYYYCVLNYGEGPSWQSVERVIKDFWATQQSWYITHYKPIDNFPPPPKQEGV
jgi:hypothetical protein